jgi:hypothetical protein
MLRPVKILSAVPYMGHPFPPQRSGTEPRVGAARTAVPVGRPDWAANCTPGADQSLSRSVIRLANRCSLPITNSW